MRLLARIMLIINFLICGLVGVVSIVDPGGTAQMIGYALDGAKGTAEFVTVYGGAYIGLAAFLAVALRTPRYLESALGALALIATGAMLARLGGWLILGPEAAITRQLLYTEIGWALSGWIGWAAAWWANAGPENAR
jgi:hypothetical protein